MIIIKAVRWTNFLSTGNIFSEIKLSDCKMTLICGDNGSGKSTMMDAICFGLFGKPFRKINKPQLVNSITNKNTLVEIEFEANGKQYMIRRGIKPTVFEILQDGNLINQSADQRDYQQIIEQNILKINFKTFCQIVILGSANFTPFMQLSAGQRRQIIEDLLDIQVFSTMNVLLKDKININKEQMSDNDHQTKLLEQLIELNRSHAKLAKQNNKKIIKQKNEEIDQYRLTNDKLKTVLETNNNQLSLLNQQIKQINAEIVPKIGKAQQLRTKMNNSISIANKQLQFYNTNSQCSSCKQPIDDNFKNQQIINNQQLITEINDKQQLLQATIDKLNSKQQQVNQLIEQTSAITTNNITICSEIASNQKVVASLTKEIDAITNQKFEIVDNDVNINKLSQLNSDRKQLIDQRELYNIASVLLKDNGIKSQIIRQYIPIINKLINKYLDQLEFFCQFNIDENFQESIKSGYRDEFSYDSFSQGEKMRIDLSLMFTWREIARVRNSAAVNLLILDEVMDSSLDTTGTDEFIKIIQQLADNNNVFVISHKQDQIIDRFNRVITFQKVKNFSKII